MTVKSDNPAHSGLHCFERAGLGLAPFRCVDMITKKYQACQGAPVQPGGCCDYCGNGIMFCFVIKSRDGKTFEVGSDCVARTGDAGLIKSYKTLPAVRAANRDKAKAKDDRVIAEWHQITSDETAKAKLSSIMIDAYRGGKEPWLTFALRAWGYCGAAGRARYLKAAKKLLAEISEKEAA